MRTRVFKDVTSSASMPQWWRSIPGDYFVYNTTSSYVNTLWYETMRDVNTPNFYERMRAGEVILNPKLKYSNKHVEKHCEVYFSDNIMESVYSFLISEVHDVESPITVDSYDQLNQLVEDDYREHMNIAVTQAWSNVDVSEAAALASLGELPETVRWLTSLITRMIRTIRFFRSKEKRLKALKALNPTATADSLSDLWLEFRYAVRPIVFEAKQCVEALKAQVEKGSRKTARGWDLVEEESTTILETYDNLMDELWLTRKESSYANFRAGVLYEIESDINGLMALWGLDQTAEAIWELTPFSFIIDWFFNIGNVISSWSVSPSLRALGSWVTMDLVQRLEYKPQGHLYSSSSFNSAVPVRYDQEGSFNSEVRWSIREIDPRRTLLPQIKLNLDLAKTLDLATIGRTMFRSMRA